jgi:hypothetical protein
MQVPILNFSGGEVSPDMYGRPDLPLYGASAKRMENLVPKVQGPMQGRSGTAYGHTAANNNKPRLERFKYSDTEVFILEFTNLLVRIYEDTALTLDPSAQNIIDITQANPGVVEVTAHGYANGDELYIEGIVGMTELNGRFVRVANVTTDTFELKDLFNNFIDTSGFTAYGSAGTVTQVFEVASPYTTAQLNDFDFAQAANVAYTFHRLHDIYKLTRVSASSWTFATYMRTDDPFTGAGKWPGTGTFYQGRLWAASTVDNPDGLWSSMGPATDGTARYDSYTNAASDADEAIAIPLSGPQGDVETANWIRAGRNFLAAGTPNGIVGVDAGENAAAITPTSIRVRPVDPYGAQAVWPIAAGSTIYYVQKGGKLVRSLEYDLVSDGEKSYDRTFVSSHIAGRGAIIKIVLQRGVPDIIWAVTSLGALLGVTTKTKEDVSGWHRYPLGGSGKAVSVMTEPVSVGFDRVWVGVERRINSVTTHYTEYFTDPFKFEPMISYYTGKENKEADRLAYINEIFEAQRRITYLDSHLVLDGSDQAVTITPAAVTGDNIVFTASGNIFALADEGREIHKIYQDRAGGGRAIIRNFVDATHVECEILIDFDSTDVIAAGDWYFTTDEVRGLYHLEGETVRVLADGRVHPDVVVTDGRIGLDFQAGFVAAGKNYRMLWQSLSPVILARDGNTLTRSSNVGNFDIVYYETMGLKFGTDPYDLQDIPSSSFGQLPDRPPVPDSGVSQEVNASEWGENLSIYIVQEQPYPCFINAINLDMVSGLR